MKEIAGDDRRGLAPRPRVDEQEAKIAVRVEPDGQLGAPTSTFLPAIKASIGACPIGTLI